MVGTLLLFVLLCMRFYESESLRTRLALVRHSSLHCCESKDLATSYSHFVVSKLGPVTSVEISNDNLIRIVNLEATDAECNLLCWKCLGYQYDDSTGTYSADNVFPKWKATYPHPPDVIGVTRSYDAIIDKPVRDASMSLMRSIPRDFKGGVRALEKEGFRGFKLSELTPNKTRRAQLVNWLIYYREKLFNKTIEQLRAEREIEAQQAQRAKLKEQQVLENLEPPVFGDDGDIVPIDLPSERNYQKHRLD